MQYITLPAYSVIGREGATSDSEGFIQTLWSDANAHFVEVSALAAQPLTLWGAMCRMDGSLQPWEENFSKGRYLAGIEAAPGTQPPKGWAKWDFPAYEALALPMTPTAFAEGLACLAQNGLSLVMAAQERTNPATGETLLLFPIKLL